jgi:hypothetical protein
LYLNQLRRETIPTLNMSAGSFSKRIERALAVRTDVLSLELDSASSSDGDGQPLANADGADNISSRLQKLLDIRAQLSDSSDGVLNSGGAGKKNITTRQSSEEVTVDSIHTPTEENHSNTEDEFVPNSPGVTFKHDPSDDVGDVTGDNDAGESPK